MENTKAAVHAATGDANGTDGSLYRARPHLLALFWPFVLLAASCLLALAAERFTHGLGLRVGFRAEQAASLETACRWLLLAVPAVFAANAAAAVVECRTTRYRVTEDRVIAASAFLRSTSSTVYLAKVESVVRDQGPLERLFDAGTVTLVGTGGGRDTLTNVRDVTRFMAALERALPRG